MSHSKFVAIAAGAVVLAGVGSADAAVRINEVSGSTPGSDYEFIELFNDGVTDVDLTGWTIELWESDFVVPGLPPNAQDGSSPYALDISGNGTIIPAGGYGLLANATAEGEFSVTADILLPANAIENSSYTMLLKDNGGTIIQSVFVTDGGTNDAANDGASVITPDHTVGPDGSFLPGAFNWNGNGYDVIPFNDIDTNATPTAGLVPEPASLALMGFGAAAMLRRRK